MENAIEPKVEKFCFLKNLEKHDNDKDMESDLKNETNKWVDYLCYPNITNEQLMLLQSISMDLQINLLLYLPMERTCEKLKDFQKTLYKELPKYDLIYVLSSQNLEISLTLKILRYCHCKVNKIF